MRLFFKSFFITVLIVSVLSLSLFLVCRAYENTLATKYGIYSNAVEISKDYIKILDFILKL